MKCSECTKRVRPVVAIDIDGTLGAYHEHFINFAEGYFGHPLPQHGGYDGEERFWQYLGLELESYRQAKLAYRQGGLKRTMPRYKGAAELCQGLRDSGAEVWICTTRPYLRLDNIDPDTREWLDRGNIPYDYMLYGDEKYQQLADLVEHERVVGVLDDLPEHFEVAEALGFNPILRQHHHNFHFRKMHNGNLPIARSLAHALDLLRNEVVGWQLEYGGQLQNQ